MTSLRAWVVSALLLTVTAVAFLPGIARAAPGCAAVGGGCVPLDALHPAVLGPCDASCPSDFCVASFCVDPGMCGVPCTTDSVCPPLTIGNNVVTPEGGTSGGVTECGYGTGCGFVVASRTEGVFTEDPTSACMHAGETGLVALLNGDCDQDGVRNVAEGQRQFCVRQVYAGPSVPSPIPSCSDGCRGGAGCVPFAPGPHGGVVCADGGSAAYGCTGLATCPSTFDRPATACLARNDFAGSVIGACLYVPTCRTDPNGCFDFTTADDPGTWLESAYTSGDCDDDGVLNGVDPADCGAQLVVWTDEAPFADPGSRAGCAAGLMCLASECTRLGICGVPGAIGLSCDPDSPTVVDYCTAAMGVAAECVYAGTSSDAAEALCIPSEPADDSCILRGIGCFAVGDGIDPADSYHLGDCDGDMLINGVDDDVCNAAVDAGVIEMPDAAVRFMEAGTPVDEVGLANPDAASDSPDAGGSGDIDADVVEDGRFAGSGCSCRVERARAPSGAGLLALLVLGLVARARRARARR